MTWNPESQKILSVESGILGFGIRNTTEGNQNPTKDCNPESKFHWQILKRGTRNPESTAWNPESMNVLDSLTRGETMENDSHWQFFLLSPFFFPLKLTSRDFGIASLIHAKTTSTVPWQGSETDWSYFAVSKMKSQ